MTIRRPGLPGDLPRPETLWARWGLLAVLEATTEGEVVRAMDLGGNGGVAATTVLDRAERYELTPQALESLVAASAYDHWDLPAMLRALHLTGLAGEGG